MKKVLVIAMAVYLFGFSLFAWLKPADEFSDTERRGLKQFPDLSVQTVLKGCGETKLNDKVVLKALSVDVTTQNVDFTKVE